MENKEYKLRLSDINMKIQSLKQMKQKYWHERHSILTRILLLKMNMKRK